MDGTVLHFCDNPQPDDFLGLLQELAEDSKCKQPQTQATTSLPQGISRGDCSNNSIRANHRTSTSGMVGLSPAELESLNELISIDHVYVKSQPINLQRGKDGQHKSNIADRVHGRNGSIMSSPEKCSTSTSVLKRREVCELSEQTVSLSEPSVSSHAAIAGYDTLNHDFPLSTFSQSLLSSQLSSSSVTDAFINSLSDSDMDHSLNLFQDLDFSMIESNIAADPTKASNHINNICMNNTHDLVSTGEVLDNDLSATKLFDEIYEHYLSIKDSSSPASALSDSGISSDLDALSPQSIEEPLHDDMWHDTSFADLFPDLQ
uniref:Uncharacterized protein n=1 Tax=Arion vulgaris TaxID=1028688 RepID=A0A0B6Y9H7_9EUPU